MALKHRVSKTRKRIQRGGVGYSLDVFKNCKIGGLPEVVATSDCPSMGPGDPGFAKALYGGRRKVSKKTKTTKRRGSKAKKGKKQTKRRVNKKGWH